MIDTPPPSWYDPEDDECPCGHDYDGPCPVGVRWVPSACPLNRRRKSREDYFDRSDRRYAETQEK